MTTNEHLTFIILETIFVAASESRSRSFGESAISEALQMLASLPLRMQTRLLEGVTVTFSLEIDDGQEYVAAAALEEVFVEAMYAQMQEVIRKNGYTFNDSTDVYEPEE